MFAIRYPRAVTAVLLCMLSFLYSCQSQRNIGEEEAALSAFEDVTAQYSDALVQQEDEGKVPYPAKRQRVTKDGDAKKITVNIDLGTSLRSYYSRDNFALVRSLFPGEDPLHVRDLSCTLMSKNQDGGVENRSPRACINIEELFSSSSVQPEGESRAIQKVLIIGNPGTGKTTLSKHLAYRWAAGTWGQGFEAVYVLPVRELHQSKYDGSSYYKKATLATAIVNHCFPVIEEEESYQSLRRQVCATLSSPSTLVVLDGLDERAGANASLIEQAEEEGNHQLLMLSRSYGIEKERKMADIEVEQTGLNDDQLRSYVCTVLPSGQSASLLSLLSTNRPIAEIAHIPTNLYSLCFLYKKKAPHNSAQAAVRGGNLLSFSLSFCRELAEETWERYVRQVHSSPNLLSYEQKAKQVGLPIEDRDVLFDALGKLAMAAINRENGAIHALIDRTLVKSMINRSADDYLSVMQQSGFLLLLPTGVGQYKFPHPMFQEYFVSRWLARQLFAEDLQAREEARDFFEEYQYRTRYGTIFTFLAGEAMNHNSKKERLENLITLLTLANKDVDEAERKDILHLRLQMRLVNEWLYVSEESEIKERFPALERSFRIRALLEAWFEEGVRLVQERADSNDYILTLTRILEDFESVAKQVAPQCLAVLLNKWAPGVGEFEHQTFSSDLVRIGQLARSSCLTQLQAATKHANADVQAAARYAVSQLNLDLTPLVLFGPSDWEKHFGVRISDAPSLPNDLDAILDSPCPFWVGKTVRETHILFLLPAVVEGEPLTLTKLGGVLKGRFPDSKAGFFYYNDLVRDQFSTKVSSESPYWVLMTRDLLPGSCGMSYGFNQAEIANYGVKGYDMPLAIEAVVGLLTHYVCTGERLLEESYTDCKELLSIDNPSSYDATRPIIVGDFDHQGISILDNSLSGGERNGVLGSRKL